MIPSKISTTSSLNFYENPPINNYNDVIFMPGTGHMDQQFGIFTREGYLITQSAFFHKYPSALKGQPISIDPIIGKSAPVLDSAIFVGFPHTQYGHFITEFISRLHSLVTLRKADVKLLVRSVESLEEVFKLPWAKELMALMNLTQDDFICPTHPIIVRNLILPAASFAEEGFCYHRMARFCNDIGNKAIDSLCDDEIIFDRNIYLSRSRIKSGTIRIEGEEDLEKYLEEENFKIVYPEELKVSQQISLFRQNNFVVGILGSAFHTSIFSPSPKGIILNAKDNNIDGPKGYPAPSLSYLSMDGINNSSFDYYDITDIHNTSVQDGNYLVHRKIADPAQLARNLVERVRTRRKTFTVPNMGRSGICDTFDIKFYEIITHEGKNVKCDGKNGRVFAGSESLEHNLQLVCLGPELFRGPCFLIASSETAICFKLGQTSLYGPALPVAVHRQDNNKVAIRSLENGRFISAEGAVMGDDVKATASQVDDWETFELRQCQNPPLCPHSRQSHLLAILLIVFDFSRNGNMEYYINLFDDLVIYSFSIKRLFI